MKILSWLTSWLSTMVLIIALSTSAKWIDSNVYPVVSQFNVQQVVKDETEVILYGSMWKNRDCRYLNMTAYYKDRMAEESSPVHIWFPESVTGTRASIFQTWGPWVVDLPAHADGSLSLYVNHRCHTLWDTSTKLIEIPVKL